MGWQMTMPWYKRCPSDWAANVSLRACSLAARGLWTEMLDLMHRSERRGYLLGPDGQPMGVDLLAAMLGRPVDEVRGALEELTRNRVFQTDGGVIVSGRLIREEREHENTRRRVAKHRAKPCNAPCNGVGNASVTRKTKDSDIDSDSEEDINTGASACADTPGGGFALTADEPRKADWTPPAHCWGAPRYGVVLDPSTRRFVWRDDADQARDFAAWAESYPAVDCESELRRAAEWCLSGARGRKGNYRRFIVTWLGRAQDRGGTRGAGGFGTRTPHGQRKALEDATDWSGLSADDAQRQADELIGRGSAA